MKSTQAPKIEAFFSFSILFFFLFAIAQPLTASPFPLEPEAFYVLAPSGMNLRETSDPKSAKLVTVGYGEKVKLIAKPASSDMLIDNLNGGMAKVSYNGQTGYMFDGYLSQYPAPQKAVNSEEELEKYVELVRGVNDNVLLETCRRDWGGYYQFEKAITLPSQDLEEGFIIAKRLFDIPAKLHLPKFTGELKSVQENPEKEEYIWSDEIMVERNEDHQIISIQYYRRGEGGGRSVTIIPAEGDEPKMKIFETGIAD